MNCLKKRDIIDLVEFAEDHIAHFDAVPMEFETRDGEVIPYEVVWDICKYMLPDMLP